MKILNRYILRFTLRNLLLSVGTLLSLFMVVDFFDRLDNIIGQNPSVGTVLLYFLLKIPFFINQTLPISMLVTTLLTIGLLAKNSELTAMRSAGIPVLKIAAPLLKVAAGLVVFSLILGEIIVPYTFRRTKEIYNIDIQKKNVTGEYSQNDFWWRDGDYFFTADFFDSRDNTIHSLSRFRLDPAFQIVERTNAKTVTWIDSLLRWNMMDVAEIRFRDDPPKIVRHRSRPIIIRESPEDFYDMRTDPNTLSYRALAQYIKRQQKNGVAVKGFLTELHAKIALPLLILIIALITLPFSLQPARTGSLATSLLSGLTISFAYYAVHSFSVALGQAEIWPPMLAAWCANIVMIIAAVILNLGAESPA